MIFKEEILRERLWMEKRPELVPGKRREAHPGRLNRSGQQWGEKQKTSETTLVRGQIG